MKVPKYSKIFLLITSTKITSSVKLTDVQWRAAQKIANNMKERPMKKSKKEKKATELEFLKWFYLNADFGPADGDVRASLKEEFMVEFRKNLPKGYELEE